MNKIIMADSGEEKHYDIKGNRIYPDDITKPNHYHKGGIDVIGYAEQKFSVEELKGFYRINILKYVTRYDEKGTPLSDLGKADFYLQKLKELECGAGETD